MAKSKQKSAVFTSNADAANREAGWTLRVLVALDKLRAYSPKSAVTMAAIRSETLLDVDDLETILHTTACASFAILPVYGDGNSPVSSSRQRVMGFYLSGNWREIYRAADDLKTRARNLLGRAADLETTALALGRCKMPWHAREDAIFEKPTTAREAEILRCGSAERKSA